ncbi:unnamed protein product, partial [Prorocentrum cordatum]
MREPSAETRALSRPTSHRRADGRAALGNPVAGPLGPEAGKRSRTSRLWKQYATRWRRNSWLSEAQCTDRLPEELPWDLRAKLQYIPEQDLSLGRIVHYLGQEAGRREDDEVFRVGNEATRDIERKKDEDLLACVTRRRRQFERAREIGVDIPPKVQGMLLLQGARVSAQGKQNVRSLTRGSLLGPDIMWALPQLDTGGLARGDDPKSRSSLLEPSSAKSSSEIGDGEIEPPELGILVELSGRDLSEDAVSGALAQMGKGRQMTWEDNKDLKNAAQKDRGYWKRRRRLAPAQLELVTNARVPRAVAGRWAALAVSVGAYFDGARAEISRLAEDARLFDTKNHKKRLLEDSKPLLETQTRAWARCTHLPWRTSSSGNQCAPRDFRSSCQIRVADRPKINADNGSRGMTIQEFALLHGQLAGPVRHAAPRSAVPAARPAARSAASGDQWSSLSSHSLPPGWAVAMMQEAVQPMSASVSANVTSAIQATPQAQSQNMATSMAPLVSEMRSVNDRLNAFPAVSSRQMCRCFPRQMRLR